MSASPLQPVKAAALVLDSAWTLQEALRHMVRGCLRQILANAAGAARSRNSEFLHQTRIALRRMRSALKLQRPADPAVVALRAELKWLAGSLGAARDWDVLLEETLQPMARAHVAAPQSAMLSSLMRAARRRRAGARRLARTALLSDRHAALPRALERWLDAPFDHDPAAAALPLLAAREVRKRHKRLLRDAADFRHQTPEERHGIRIDTKRLRYAVEFFSSLFPGKAAKRYRHELAVLQDALGKLNDAATAGRLLESLPGIEGPRPFVDGWLAAREADGLAAAEGALARLAECKRFWKTIS